MLKSGDTATALSAEGCKWRMPGGRSAVSKVLPEAAMGHE